MDKAHRHKVAKPLLPTGRVKSARLYLNHKPGPSHLDIEDGPLYKMKGKRRTSLIGSDALILVLELLQILAVLQSMSLKWVWPTAWLTYANFILIFNLDVWDFVKVSSGVFKGVQNYDIPSSVLPYSFNYMVLGWGVLIFLLFTAFIVVYCILRYRRRPYLLVHTAKMERGIIIICQILALPIGTVFFKLFHCTSTGTVDVLNDLTCFSAIHWAYLLFGLVIIVALFIVLPAWMIYRTRHEVVGSTSKHHESYLQLKEMEYMSGLDVIWLVKGFHIFSSFRLNGVHYRSAMHIFKLLLLIAYASLYEYILPQAVTTAVLLILMWLLFVIILPFRILSFNLLFIICFLCLIGDAVFGASIANVRPSDVSSPWLVEPYASWVMVTLNVFMAIVIFAFLVYLIIAHSCCGGRRGKPPIWPAMNYQGADQLSFETNKFMNAVLRGRTILEKCRSVHPMFAPVHELSQQIQVINAYLREAELLSDALHGTLWDLLDEMILAYEKLEPKSLFGESVKDSIRSTSADLMKMMPMFSRRMAQRDYDLILVSPMKRRMLLKMFVMGVFLNGRSEKVAKQQITGPELDRIWPESSSNPVIEDKHEYFEDLYPEPLCGPDQEEMYADESLNLPLDLLELDEDEKSISSFIKGAPDLLSFPPTSSRQGSSLSEDSRTGYINPAFVSDTTPAITTENTQGKQQPEITLDDFEEGETSTDNTKVQQEVTAADVHVKTGTRGQHSERTNDGGKKKKNRDPSPKKYKSKPDTKKPAATDKSGKDPTSTVIAAPPENELALPQVSKLDTESSDQSKPTTERSQPSSEHVTSEKEKSSEVLSGDRDAEGVKHKKHKSLKKKKSHGKIK
ncbi:uncharacterized protein LOC121375280 [Gigantopelta aegis]|uniref:uncharacterized protein LOC121375280 n=1 Tax=Gigantopelta aegis TaxID=1735272 RepID=UPI001B88D4BF|nr:uncharacterized protein LOC121375280 [Gigantopelta aegis]